VKAGFCGHGGFEGHDGWLVFLIVRGTGGKWFP
jgi:hypothetical protein